MRFLLLNNNPAVSRLILLSAKKIDYDLIEAASLEEIEEERFVAIFIDSDSFNSEELALIQKKNLTNKLIYIGPRGSKKPEGMDFILEKPFLPTDFLELAKSLEPEDESSFEDGLEDGFEDDGDIDSLLEEDKDEEDNLINLDNTSLPHEEEFTFEEDSSDESSKVDELEEDGLVDLEEADELEEPEDEEDFEGFEDDEEPEEFELKEGGILDSEDVKEVQGLLEDDLNLLDEMEEDSEDEDSFTSQKLEELEIGQMDKVEDSFGQEDFEEDSKDEDELSLEDELDLQEEDLSFEDEKSLESIDFEEDSLSSKIEEDMDLVGAIDDFEEGEKLDFEDDSKDDELVDGEDDFEDEELDELEDDEDVKDGEFEDDTNSIKEELEAQNRSEDPFFGLSERELKIALGEAVEELKTDGNQAVDELKSEIKNEVTKALTSALMQTRVKEFLKNTKINITIDFEEA